MTDGASAALQSAAGAESPKRVLSAQMGKAIIVIATVFICLLAALFGNVFAKIQPDLGYTINLSGLKLLSLLGQEGFNTVDLWQNSIFVPVPTLIPVVTLVLIALLVLLITLSVLRYTVGEKSGKSVIWSRALSIACFGVALFIAAVYVYMLFSKAKAYDYYGDERYLYNVFETKAVLLVYAVALLAAGAIEWKLSLKTVLTWRFMQAADVNMKKLCHGSILTIMFQRNSLCVSTKRQSLHRQLSIVGTNAQRVA